jgi:hypothetical protein
MAEKSLVNDEAVMFGADPLEPVLALELEAELELELEDELPQAATPMLAVTARAAMTLLLLSKCTKTSSLSAAGARHRAGPRRECHGDSLHHAQ